MLSSSLTTHRGFHSIYSTQIILNDTVDFATCTLHLLYILPPRIFVDAYELANRRDLYSFRLSGISNLELPVTEVNPEGSALLLNVLLPRPSPHGTQKVTVDIPLHLRYGETAQSKASDDGTIKVSWPTGFWACPLFGKFYHTARFAIAHS